MLQFVKNPNCPSGEVRTLLVGSAYVNELRLYRFGITAIGIPENAALDFPVRSHVDMQAVHLYSEKIVSNKGIICKAIGHCIENCRNSRCKATELLRDNICEICGEKGLKSDYPDCAAYNVLVIGQSALYNPECIDPVLKTEIDTAGYSSIYVKQGFARCSVCVVNENAVITADRGIARELLKQGAEVLLIRPGFISLPGYNYGFIGGVSFKITRDKIAFTGNLNAHPDRDSIESFIRAHGVETVYLTKREAFDIGSAIPLIEEI